MSPGYIALIVLVVIIAGAAFLYFAKIDPRDGTKRNSIQVSKKQTSGIMQTKPMQPIESELPLPVTASANKSQKSNKFSNFFSGLSNDGSGHGLSEQNIDKGQCVPNNTNMTSKSTRNALAGGVFGAIVGHGARSYRAKNTSQFNQPSPNQVNIVSNESRENDHQSSQSLSDRNSAGSRSSQGSSRTGRSRESSNSNTRYSTDSENSRDNASQTEGDDHENPNDNHKDDLERSNSDSSEDSECFNEIENHSDNISDEGGYDSFGDETNGDL